MNIRIAGFCFVLAFLLGSCGQDKDLVPDQQTKIESYLKSKGITDFVYQNGVYRVVPNADRPSYATDPEAAAGDSVSFMFEAYTFGDKPGNMYSTNKEEKISADTIINPDFWSFKPVEAKVGSGLMSGVRRGLPGCRQGDSVVLLITADLAYGTKEVGVVPPNSAIMMVLNINEVKK